jgi:hypothetical protein
MNKRKVFISSVLNDNERAYSLNDKLLSRQLGSYVPARRATRVYSMGALRWE